MQETLVRFLGLKDFLEKGVATQFGPGDSPWTEESSGLRSMGSQRVGQGSVTFPFMNILLYASRCIYGNIF